MFVVTVAEQDEEVFVIEHEVRAFVEGGEDLQRLLEFTGECA